MKKEQFESVTKWQNETFEKSTSLSKVSHLQQEVKELESELKNGINNHPPTLMEFADCFILLFGAASSYGMTYQDIVNVIDAKMIVNKTRKWGSPDKNGVVNHIKNDRLVIKKQFDLMEFLARLGCFIILLIPVGIVSLIIYFLF